MINLKANNLFYCFDVNYIHPLFNKQRRQIFWSWMSTILISFLLIVVFELF